MLKRRFFLAGLAMAFAAAGALSVGAAKAESLEALNAEADAALKLLEETQPVSKDMAKKAKGLLIFPETIKGGFVLGAAAGKGVLRVKGKHEGVYQSAAVSYGLQAGIAKFGYVMFLMDDAALKYVRDTEGWEVRVGPNVTVADEGVAAKLSTTTAEDGVYVFFVSQKGFFAGAGIEGTKISKIAE